MFVPGSVSKLSFSFVDAVLEFHPCKRMRSGNTSPNDWPKLVGRGSTLSFLIAQVGMHMLLNLTMIMVRPM